MRAEILPLTSLRFAAALWVFLFHIDLRWPLGLPRILEGIVQQGAVGMSLFFILSGFVLGYSYGKPGLSVSHYAWHRFARIYPVYTLAALVTIPFLSLSGDPLSAAQIAFMVVAHLFMLQAWFPPLFHFWNFNASWSLSAEAFFYAVFPFAVRSMLEMRQRPLFAFMAGMYLCCVVPGIAWLLFRSTSALVYYSIPIFRLPEFLLGVAFAILQQRGFRLPRPGLIAVGCVLTLGSFLAWLGPRTGAYVTGNAVAVPAIALLIAALAQGSQRVMAWRPLLVLGRSSYAFYSMQPLVLALLIVQQRGQAPWNPLVVLGGATIALTLLSLLTHYLIEEPVRRRLTRGKGAAARAEARSGVA